MRGYLPNSVLAACPRSTAALAPGGPRHSSDHRHPLRSARPGIGAEGSGGPTAGVSGPARHAWGGPGSRSRRGLKRKLGTAEVARETRRAERAAAASPAPPPRPGLLGRHAAPSARQPATRRRRAALVRSRRGAPAGSPAPVLRHRRRAPPRAGAVGGGTLAAATVAPAAATAAAVAEVRMPLWDVPCGLHRKPASPRIGRSRPGHSCREQVSPQSPTPGGLRDALALLPPLSHLLFLRTRTVLSRRHLCPCRPPVVVPAGRIFGLWYSSRKCAVAPSLSPGKSDPEINSSNQ
ncbi:uncharacterized protein LOC142838751 [Microtus pennsylvanicus]|uniref:uncharacterized protein LOC142838751 n=1 Tax=Microtus pennsylvanicus TaxID=10058 RepID=UPI003F6C5AFF